MIGYSNCYAVRYVIFPYFNLHFILSSIALYKCMNFSSDKCLQKDLKNSLISPNISLLQDHKDPSL